MADTIRDHMNRIYENVETDIGKYLDINTILKKLEENNIYEDLCEIFLNIHRRESVFTVTELKRISQNKNNNIDLVEQYWVNSDIFRSNLVLIVTSLINSIWNNEDIARNYIEGEDLFGGGEGAKLQNRINQHMNGSQPHQGNSGRNDYFGHSSKRNTGGRGDQNPSNRKSNSKNYGKADLLEGTSKPTTLADSMRRPKSVGKAKYEDRPQENQGQQDSGYTNQYAKGLKAKGPKNYGHSELLEDVDYDEQNLNPNYGRDRHCDKSRQKSASKSPGPIGGDELDDYENWDNRSMTRSCGNINSVYTKILNSTQSNKIKKLVGEKNSDLDSEF